MADVTLEELTKRLAVVEERLGIYPIDGVPPHLWGRFRPGKGNWHAILEAMKGVDLDIEGIEQQNAIDLEHEKREADRWRAECEK